MYTSEQIEEEDGAQAAAFNQTVEQAHDYEWAREKIMASWKRIVRGVYDEFDVKIVEAALRSAL